MADTIIDGIFRVLEDEAKEIQTEYEEAFELITADKWVEDLVKRFQNNCTGEVRNKKYDQSSFLCCFPGLFLLYLTRYMQEGIHYEKSISDIQKGSWASCT